MDCGVAAGAFCAAAAIELTLRNTAANTAIVCFPIGIP
jgi:hypothetical protein